MAELRKGYRASYVIDRDSVTKSELGDGYEIVDSSWIVPLRVEITYPSGTVVATNLTLNCESDFKESVIEHANGIIDRFEERQKIIASLPEGRVDV